jgi:hypothetical protein
MLDANAINWITGIAGFFIGAAMRVYRNRKNREKKATVPERTPKMSHAEHNPMAPTPQFKFCINCDAKIAPTTRFCTQCGAKQE